MTLQEQLQNEFNSLLKERHNPKKELLKVILTELTRGESQIKTNDEVLKTLKKMKENAIECNNVEEVSILSEYLPDMMEKSEIEEFVTNIITENNFNSMRDMGKVMSIISTSESANIIDNKIAAKITKEILAKMR